MDDFESLTFEEALQRLEQIVEELDGGTLPLEEALAKFQEGTLLRQWCERKLAEAECLVEELLAEEDESEETAPEEGGSLFGDEV